MQKLRFDLLKKTNDTVLIKKRLKNISLDLKSRIRKDEIVDPGSPIGYEIRTGHIDNQAVKRIIIYYDPT